tara:strand:+ start:448 stop:552 length:105 start_codon:yes stop_codon:yes gene_type:complete
MQQTSACCKNIEYENIEATGIFLKNANKKTATIG